MKVLDLQCRHGHVFEGWFGSHEDFSAQRENGLLTCPMCSDTEVSKMPSAPRLNLGHADTTVRASAVDAPQAPTQEPAQILSRQMQGAWMSLVRHVLAHTEDVGTKFAEEARKIHHGEAQDRHIRGQASREETEALLEEGIDILPLPIPAGLKEPLQ